MPTAASVSSEMTAGGPDVFLHVPARCNQQAIDSRRHQEKVERLTFDIESGREGKTHASNVSPVGLKATIGATIEKSIAGLIAEDRRLT